MPVTEEQAEWLEGRYVDFRAAQRAKATRKFFPALYLDFQAAWPCEPSEGDVKKHGGIEAALKQLIDEQNTASQSWTHSSKLMVHWWFYNRIKAEGGGGGNGGHGRLKISSEPQKKLAAHQAYWTLFNEEKARPRFLEVWKERHRTTDNTDYLGIDEGLIHEPELSPEQQRVEDDRRIASISLGERTKLIQELYDNESQEVKAAVEKFRSSVNGPVQTEMDLLVRLERLKSQDSNIDSLNVTMTRLMKNIVQSTGMRPTIILGGPIPSQGGKPCCFLYSYSPDGLNYIEYNSKFQTEVMPSYAEYVKASFPPNVCDALSIAAVQKLLEEQQAMDHALTAVDTNPPNEPTSQVPAKKQKQPKPRRKAAKKQANTPGEAIAALLNDPNALRLSQTPDPTPAHLAPADPPSFPPTSLIDIAPTNIAPTNAIEATPIPPAPPVFESPTLIASAGPSSGTPMHSETDFSSTVASAEHVPPKSAPAPSTGRVPSSGSAIIPSLDPECPNPGPAAIPTPGTPSPSIDGSSVDRASTAFSSLPSHSNPMIDPALVTASSHPLAPTSTTQVPSGSPASKPPSKIPAIDTSMFSAWLVPAYKYLAALDTDPFWHSLIKAFIDHEASYGFPGGAKFIVSWIDAPPAVTWWQEKAKQNVAKVPEIVVPDFGDCVRKWWLELQPDWRKPDLSRDTPADHSWLEYKVAGPGGYFLVVMCMSWWLPFVTAQNRTSFDALMDDIIWVLRQSDAPPSNEMIGSSRRARTAAVAKNTAADTATTSAKRKAKESAPTSVKQVKRTRRK